MNMGAMVLRWTLPLNNYIKFLNHGVFQGMRIVLCRSGDVKVRALTLAHEVVVLAYKMDPLHVMDMI